MAISSKEYVDFLYNAKLPQVYRDYDRDVEYALYRYLQALVDGGYGYIIESVNGLLDLFNPSVCPVECLPYFCQSFGITYYAEIPEIYWRRLLANIGEIIHRRGTYSCIKYLVRALTGLDVLLYYKRGYNETHTAYGRFLTAMLQSEDVDTILNMEVATTVVQKFIQEFVPHYITSVKVGANIKTQLVQTEYVRKGFISNGSSTQIFPFRSAMEDVKTTYYRGFILGSSCTVTLVPIVD